MRKRAGTLRHFRLQLDALEERSLLSAVGAMSVGSPAPMVIVEKGPPVTAPTASWDAAGWHNGEAHVISSGALSQGDWSPGVNAFSGSGRSPGVGDGKIVDAGLGPYGPLPGGSQTFVAGTTAPGGGARAMVISIRGDGSQDIGSIRNSVNTSYSDFTNATNGWGSNPSTQSADGTSTPDGTEAMGATAAVMGAGVYGTEYILPPVFVSHLLMDTMIFSQMRMGPPPAVAMHANMDPSTDDHSDPNAGHDPTIDPTIDLDAQAAQAVVHGSNAFGSSSGTTSVAEALGRDASAAVSLYGPGATPALALRVAAPSQGAAGTIGQEPGIVRLAAPAASDPLAEGVAVVTIPAAGATRAATGVVSVGPGEAPLDPVDAGTMVVDTESPRPHGLGLIDNVLPFDRDTVAAAIDRFFDRFDQSDGEMDEDKEPAALTPPPGALLLAVAATEVARRHWKRKREEDAAARPRRRDVEGLGSEESFGSSGPWSSRLS